MSEDETTTSAADLGIILLLTMLADLRMATGLDDDGSGAVGRMLCLLGASADLARAVQAPGMPWDPASAAARERLKALALRAEPVLARLAERPENRP